MLFFFFACVFPTCYAIEKGHCLWLHSRFEQTSISAQKRLSEHQHLLFVYLLCTRHYAIYWYKCGQDRLSSCPLGEVHSSLCPRGCLWDIGRVEKLVKGRLTDHHQNTQRNARAIQGYVYFQPSHLYIISGESLGRLSWGYGLVEIGWILSR